MPSAEEEPILTERRGHVLIVRLNRPRAMNAATRAMAEAMERAMDDYEGDPDLWLTVITGNRQVFSAGHDLKAAALKQWAKTQRRGWFGLFQVPPRKPTIAAVEGHCLGGGLELALACDLIVASREATFGIPEATRNLVAVGGGLFRLPKRIPRNLAMEMALTGEPRTAEEMHRWGLVNRLTEPGAALKGALELAAVIARNGPLAVAASARIVRGSTSWTEPQAWEAQLEHADPVTDSEDFQEGLRAFREKRAPVWRGR